jgi:hypothetical protein
MADNLKNLGQAYPAAGVLTAAYTVPAGKQATSSSIIVCNQGAVAAKARISHAIAGAANTPAQYLFYDVPLQPNETRALTIGLTLAATDVLNVYSDMGTVSFNVYGVEVTP